MSKNLYEVLGVKQDASQAEIDIAYATRLAEYQKRYDKGDQDAHALIFNLKGAHEVLVNQGKREKYDESLARQKLSQPNENSISTKTDDKPLNIDGNNYSSNTIADYNNGKSTISFEIPKKFILLGFSLVFIMVVAALIYFVGGASIKNQESRHSESAKAAIFALKKLQSQTESGITYVNYLPALADTYFAVKNYTKDNPLTPESTDNDKKFNAHLINSINHFNKSKEYWGAKIDSGGAYLDCPGRYNTWFAKPTFQEDLQHYCNPDNPDNLLDFSDLKFIRYDSIIEKHLSLAGSEIDLAAAVMAMK